MADIDGEGFDHIYITVRIGTNMLLGNNGDGTFTQEAAARGLALPGHTTCMLFADFDNDSFLDPYVLSGYFTAPIELASDSDLESNRWRTMLRADENLARPSFRFSPEWKRTGPFSISTTTKWQRRA